MLNSARFMNCRMAIVAAVIMVAATSVESGAQTMGSVEPHPQTATVHLHVVSAGFIVSTGSGTGTLTTSVGAGLTVGAGAEVGRFRNANGVILELAGLQVGLAVGLGSAGMTITLQ
jgi:hypothetical protein